MCANAATCKSFRVLSTVTWSDYSKSIFFYTFFVNSVRSFAKSVKENHSFWKKPFLPLKWFFNICLVIAFCMHCIFDCTHGNFLSEKELIWPKGLDSEMHLYLNNDLIKFLSSILPLSKKKLYTVYNCKRRHLYAGRVISDDSFLNQFHCNGVSRKCSLFKTP